jgi:tryptophan-rich sensory protein
MKKINAVKLTASILLCQLAGIIGSVFTASSVRSWYSTLEKPFFTPPNWLFGPAWITLYLLMGISLYIVWEHARGSKTAALSAFAVQLVLNALWSILFFGLRMPLIAFIELAILWLAILSTLILFYRKSATAAYLLIPYLVWVTYAGALNLMIHLLN